MRMCKRRKEARLSGDLVGKDAEVELGHVELAAAVAGPVAKEAVKVVEELSGLVAAQVGHVAALLGPFEGAQQKLEPVVGPQKRHLGFSGRDRWAGRERDRAESGEENHRARARGSPRGGRVHGQVERREGVCQGH